MIGIVVGLEAEARIARPLAARLGARIEVGGGTADGACSAARRLVATGADRLISFGLAGGLDPALKAGDVLVPTEVRVGGRTIATDPALCALLGGSTRHTLFAGEAVAVSAAEKRRLHHSTGASAIDLETAGVVRAAEAGALPFAALRAVCDAASRSLPPAALTALGPDGRIALGGLLRSVLRQPAQIPDLIGLGRDAARARAALLRQSTGGR